MRLMICLLLWSASAAYAEVSVTFVSPEKFSDVRDRQFASKPDKNPHLAAIRRYTEERATRYLPAGQSLSIRFTDIDLAGDHIPQTNPNLTDVRIVTSLYPPRMSFEYEIKDADGAVLKSDRVDLKDLAFDSSQTGFASDPLRFEKRMLDKWMRKNLR